MPSSTMPDSSSLMRDLIEEAANTFPMIAARSRTARSTGARRSSRAAINAWTVGGTFTSDRSPTAIHRWSSRTR